MTDGVSATAERLMSIRNGLAQREAELEQAELEAAEKAAAAAKLAASRVPGSTGSGKPPKLHQAKPAKVMPGAQDPDKNEGSASPVQGIDDIPPVWTDLPVCLRFLLGGACKSTGAHEDWYHWGAQCARRSQAPKQLHGATHYGGRSKSC